MVKIEETYIGGKEGNKHAHKKLNAGRGAVGKAAVAGVRERDGKVKAQPVERTNAATLVPFIEGNVEQGATVYADDPAAYRALPSVLNQYRHDVIRHGAGEYVRGDVHTSGTEAVWAVLKRSIHGTWHHVSPKHLGRYVNEASFRLNAQRGCFVSWLTSAMEKEMPTKNEGGNIDMTMKREFLATVGKLVLAFAVPLLSLWSQAEVVGSHSPHPHSLEEIDPFPDCVHNCPTMTMRSGFKVYLSPLIPPEEQPLVVAGLDYFDHLIRRLETHAFIHPHFVKGLRDAQVSIFLTSEADEEVVSTCWFCYLAGSIRRIDLPPMLWGKYYDMQLPSGHVGVSVYNFYAALTHEFAHAYHDIYLKDGFDNQCVLDAYRESVLELGLHGGPSSTIYATHNHWEYFAEMITASAMEDQEGFYCREDSHLCQDSLFHRVPSATRGWPKDTIPPYFERKLYKYDYNGAALFDTFLSPQVVFPQESEVEERSLDCDPSLWYPGQ